MKFLGIDNLFCKDHHIDNFFVLGSNLNDATEISLVKTYDEVTISFRKIFFLEI